MTRSSASRFEAAGAAPLETYFGIDSLLKRRGGVAVFQCITIPDARHAAYARSDGFIRRYIFPGGHLPAVTQLVSAITAGSHGALVDGVKNIGPYYAKTLRLWRGAFPLEFDAGVRLALRREHAGMGSGTWRLSGGSGSTISRIRRPGSRRGRWAMLWLLWRGRAPRS
jgi:cyclopropane-fatty-acyl-phospholipid synthase